MTTETKTDDTNTNQDDLSNKPEDKEGAQDTQGTQTDPAGTRQENENPDGKTDAEVEYDFSVPEGVFVHPEIAELSKELAKKHNLTKEAAEDIYGETAKRVNQLGAKQMETLRNQWYEESTKDPEFGGEALTENLGYAKSALKQFFSPKFAALLAETGFENHPELIRGLVKIGKEIGEDRLMGGSTRPTKGEKSPEEIMYDNK